MDECSVDGCGKPRAYSRRMCRMHEARKERHGDPSIVQSDSGASLEERFWPRVERSEGCWEWTGRRRSPSGYGRIQEGGVQMLAHRVSYELNIGPIPEGLTIDHLCGNHGCVNPEHLDPCTSGENTRRYTAKIIHCPVGHEYTPENTRVRDGKRNCRACNRERWKIRAALDEHLGSPDD